MQTEPPENLTDSPQQATHQFLSFQVPPDIHAMVSAQELTEIVSLSPNQIVPIPDVPPQVMGVCSWRGEVLWLVDLGYLLGQDSLFQQGYRHANYSLIVVRHQRNTLGLVVNQIGTMIWHNASEIYPITLRYQISALFSGVLAHSPRQNPLVFGLSGIDQFFPKRQWIISPPLS
jgi:chemotaxis signal transduction protein